MEEFYVGQIKRGQMSINQVPARWKDAVSAKLGSDEAKGQHAAEEQVAGEGRNWLSAWQRKK